MQLVHSVDPQHLQLSAYVHTHRVSLDTIGLYVPFGHEVAFASDAVLIALQEGRYEAIPRPILEDLIRRKFLVPPEYDANVLNSYSVAPTMGFYMLYLIVVQTCNMGCTYCVVDAGDQTRNLNQKKSVLPTLSRTASTMMTWEVAKRAVDVFVAGLQKTRPPLTKVTIYGGEPLLNKDVLRKVIPYIREQAVYPGQQAPIEILCFTNGLHYSREMTEIFQENHVALGISLDGTKEHNDTYRLTLSGESTFERVVENYRKYRKARVNIGIACTINRQNHDQLDEIAKYFIEELDAPSVQFTPMQQTPGATNEAYVSMADAAASSFSAFQRLRESGVEEGLALRRLSRFSSGEFHYRDCGAVGGQLVVAPDGKMGPCQNATVGATDTFQGNVLDPDCKPQSQPNFQEWHARMPINMPDCHGCSAIALCGGGCPYNALVSKGTIWEKDPQQCGYMDQFLSLLLQDLWDRYSAHENRIANGATVVAPPITASRGL